MTNAMQYEDHMFGLMLAGGGGTRLWPKSLDKSPKQFIKLFNGKTLVEITGERLGKFILWDKIFVITSHSEHGEKIRKLLPKIPKANVIVEPERKDTAAAHALGAAYILSKDPQAVIVNAASDHFVTPQVSYERTMFAACKFAFEKRSLVAIGIKPEYPHTGLGHLKKGKHVATSEGRYIFERLEHVEKPPIELARKYTASGEYFWNANHYVWRADTFLSEVKKHSRLLSSAIEKIRQSFGKANEKQVIANEYGKLEKISVDYAISEKTDNFYMIIADYNWTDIGDWNEVWKNLPKDSDGNVIIDGESKGGSVINIDTTDALIHTDGRLIALVDVDNLIVVDTKDALLITSKSHAQGVKKIVEKLKKENRKELL